MHIHGEVKPLPNGIACIVHRSQRVEGMITVVVSEHSYRRFVSEPNVLMRLCVKALNAVLADPDGDTPIEIPEPRAALAS